MPLLCDPDAEVLLAGRVGSAAWAHLERETACRVRAVSEERGLASAPDGHAPRSIMGRLLDELGAARFAEELAALADGVALDTRVLLAHARSRASREDRFQSDLLRPARIADPHLRELSGGAGGGARARARGRAHAAQRRHDGARRSGLAGERPAALRARHQVRAHLPAPGVEAQVLADGAAALAGRAPQLVREDAVVPPARLHDAEAEREVGAVGAARRRRCW